jgi:PAS domain S-box-containing protein
METAAPTRVFEKQGTYQWLFENNPHAILLADNGLRIVDANDAACDLLGYSRPELTKLHVEALFQDTERGTVMEKLLGLHPADGSSTLFEGECVRADGEVFRAQIKETRVAKIHGTLVDRMIAIEEIGEVGTL